MAQYEVPAPITINGVATSEEAVKKGLDKITLKSAGSVPDYIGMIYKPGNFKALVNKSKAYSGLTDASSWDGVGVIPPEGMEFLYDITARHYFWAKATEITLPMLTFDLYGLTDKLPKELGLALGWKRQKVAFAPLSGGFTTTWFDGVYFFSASHPNDSRLGGVQSNLISGAASVSKLATAFNTMVAYTDPLGRPRRRRPKRVWCAAGAGMQMRSYLNAGLNLEYGTGNNNRNPFREFPVDVVECELINVLLSTTAWFVQAEESEGYKSTAIPIRTQQSTQDNHAIKHEGMFCDAFWFEDWTGWIGSLGV